MKDQIDSFLDRKGYNDITELCQIMASCNADKSALVDKARHNYTPLYHLLFNQLRNNSFNIFELGISSGASIRGWLQYFPNSLIFAADINPQSRVNDSRVKCFVCDQRVDTSVSAMWLSNELSDKMFDIIVDDGEHTYLSNRTFILNSFHKLNPGGIYIIEDVRSDQIPQFKSMVEELKTKYSLMYGEVIPLPFSDDSWDNNLCILIK